MTARHSPSPWTLVDVGEIRSADGYVVVEVNGPNRLDLIPQKKANARLIACAPELLEALENCLEYLDIAFSAEGDCFGVHHNGASDAFSAAEVIIAKAKGQP